MKINLGCGEKPLKKYINYDKYPVDDTIKYIDLEKLPLPFENESVDEIYISHVIEHLTTDKYAFMKELIRILKKNGIIIVKLPVFSPSIMHTNFFHNSNYFECLTCCYDRDSVSNPMYQEQFLDMVYIRKNDFDFVRGVQRIINIFLSLFFGEMEWGFKKR